jgi:hypothetical protein
VRFSFELVRSGESREFVFLSEISIFTRLRELCRDGRWRRVYKEISDATERVWWRLRRGYNFTERYALIRIVSRFVECCKSDKANDSWIGPPGLRGRDS